MEKCFCHSTFWVRIVVFKVQDLFFSLFILLTHLHVPLSSPVLPPLSPYLNPFPLASSHLSVSLGLWLIPSPSFVQSFLTLPSSSLELFDEDLRWSSRPEREHQLWRLRTQLGYCLWLLFKGHTLLLGKPYVLAWMIISCIVGVVVGIKRNDDQK